MTAFLLSSLTSTSLSDTRDAVYRRKTTGALFGTEKAVAESRSRLYFLKTDGLAFICFVRASMRCWSFGWSDNICGTSCLVAFLKGSIWNNCSIYYTIRRHLNELLCVSHCWATVPMQLGRQ